jgi:hypothetical protein
MLVVNMERLASVSKIMYDCEILEKQQEIYKLKKIIEDTEIPKVYYYKFDDWEEDCWNLLTKVYESINKCVEDNVEYIKVFEGNMIGTPVIFCLEKELVRLTNSEKWSETTSFEVIKNLENFINTIKMSNIHIELFRDNTLLKKTLFNFIKNGLYKLDYVPFYN